LRKILLLVIVAAALLTPLAAFAHATPKPINGLHMRPMPINGLHAHHAT
jgi:hypothetical protein